MSFNPGGGGGISTATDVFLNVPIDSDTLSYDSVSQKWKNAPVTKTQVGLGNVDNTADADKPVSTATQTVLDAKIDASEKGALDGVATLGGDGKLSAAQMPTASDVGIAALVADTQTATGAAVEGIAQSVIAASTPFNFSATVEAIPAGAEVGSIWVVG